MESRPRILDELTTEGLCARDLDRLVRQADRATARRSLPGIFTYPIACLLVGHSSSYGADHPLLVATLTGLIVAVAAARLYLVSKLEPLYERRPGLWRSLFSAGMITATLLWSAFSSLAFLFYGVSWASFLALLITATFCAMAVIVFARSLRLAYVFAISMLGPHIGVGLYLGGREGYWTAAALAVLSAYLAFAARHLHRELWQGLTDAALLDLRATELEHARTQAEAAHRSQGQFLANMSHEIRTPLGGILGMSDVLVECDDPERRLHYSEVIQSSAENLLRLVDDVLDFSKIEAGKLDFEAIDFSLHAAIHSVAELLAPRAADKGLDLELELAGGLPDWLVGDPLRLRQVLVNLIGNALKFTAEGRVAVVAEATPEDGRTWLRVEVRDTGIGIDEEARESLFSAFTQAESSTSRHYGGSGLGLAICKSIVELQGGEIGVESVPGEGSSFWFRLPYALSTLPPEERVTVSPRRPTTGELRLRALGNCRILVVDDSEVNRIVARHILDGLGFETHVANDGREAVRALDERGYDLILMDCQMPELDGYEATREIRRRQIGRRHTPIIALTAHAMREDRERCLAVGMDDYLAKPLRRDRLIGALDRALTRGTDVTPGPPLEAPEPEPETRFTGGPGELDPARIDCLREAGSGGADMLAHIATIFLRNARQRIDSLHRALARNDVKDVRLRAHSLTGSAGNLGAARLAELCHEIELLAVQGAIFDHRHKVDEAEAEFLRVQRSLEELVPEVRGAAGEA